MIDKKINLRTQVCLEYSKVELSNTSLNLNLDSVYLRGMSGRRLQLKSPASKSNSLVGLEELEQSPPPAAVKLIYHAMFGNQQSFQEKDSNWIFLLT